MTAEAVAEAVERGADGLTLWQITGELQGVRDLLLAEPATPEEAAEIEAAVKERLAAIVPELLRQATWVVRVIREQRALAGYAKAEKMRVGAIQQRRERAADRLVEFLKTAMENAGIDRIAGAGGENDITLRQVGGPPAVAREAKGQLEPRVAKPVEVDVWRLDALSKRLGMPLADLLRQIGIDEGALEPDPAKVHKYVKDWESVPSGVDILPRGRYLHLG